jgi:hypothetical protein
MKNFLYILTIFFVTSCTDKADKKKENSINEQTDIYTEQFSLTNKELEYLRVRNDYVRYFKDMNENNRDFTEIYKQDTDSLLVLEKMLREILKNSRIDSISKFGKINLETLTPEMGSGMLDGLKLNNKSKNIFVTSKSLFLDYFKSQQIHSTDNLTSKQLSDIFSALIFDARATVFYSEKLSSNNRKIIYGGIATIAQDIGSFPPDNVYVLVANDDFIYIIQKYSDKPINIISKCQTIYDSIYNKSEQYFDEYKASNLKDKSAIDKKFEIEEIAWDKYCECYQENFKNDKQYNTVQKQMEKLAKYVE